jgi:putative ABC transport system permease protein
MPAILLLVRRQIRSTPARYLFSALALASGVMMLVASDMLSRSITSEIARTTEMEAVTAFMGEQMNTGLTAIGLVINVAAGFLILNSTLMSVHQRAPELSRLRALGMERRQLLALLGLETAATGLVGIGLGILGGFGLTLGLIQLIEATSSMFNEFGRLFASSAAILRAAAIGLSVTVIATWLPLRRALAQPSIAEYRKAEESIAPGTDHRKLVYAACALFLLAAALIFLRPAVTLAAPWTDLAVILSIAFFLLCMLYASPAVVGLSARILRRPFSAWLGIGGQLAAENLARSRGRVTRTVVTLAIGVTMIVGVSGFLVFWFDELFFRKSTQSLIDRPGIGVFPINVQGGLQAYRELGSFTIPHEARQAIAASVDGRATLVDTYFVIIPELSFLGQRYFSFVLDPQALRASGELYFSFSSGDWDSAMPILSGGCGLLLTPAVAGRNGVGLYDTLKLDTPAGPLACTVAGIGPTFVGASIISLPAHAALGLGAPVSVAIFPDDPDELKAITEQVQAALTPYSGLWTVDLNFVTETQREGMKSARVLMNGMLILAIFSASLGAVNTLQISLNERAREFALLRAIGATRAQIRSMVATEAACYGLLGGILGLVTGGGLVALYVAISGGSVFGFKDFPLGNALWNTLRPSLTTGLLALALAPGITTLASLPMLNAYIGRDGFNTSRLTPE